MAAPAWRIQRRVNNKTQGVVGAKEATAIVESRNLHAKDAIPHRAPKHQTHKSRSTNPDRTREIYKTCPRRPSLSYLIFTRDPRRATRHPSGRGVTCRGDHESGGRKREKREEKNNISDQAKCFGVCCAVLIKFSSLFIVGKSILNELGFSLREAEKQPGRTLCFPFMFRSKRSALVKRLSKHQLELGSADRAERGGSGGGGGGHETASAVENNEQVVKSAANCMLKKLNVLQLELLVQSVESKGGDSDGCLLLDKGDVPVGCRTLPPHFLCCLLLRWPDLRQPFELKRLAACKSNHHDPVYICCNPYHWSRLCKPETPPPPYSKFALERFKPEDRAPSEPVSLETGGTNQYGSLSSQQTGK
uniref:MH1 domain-containing protein n=1 Tax=Strigamia maritima TaxID=126957 RepID=T1JHA7_STRMM